MEGYGRFIIEKTWALGLNNLKQSRLSFKKDWFLPWSFSKLTEAATPSGSLSCSMWCSHLAACRLPAANMFSCYTWSDFIQVVKKSETSTRVWYDWSVLSTEIILTTSYTRMHHASQVMMKMSKLSLDVIGRQNGFCIEDSARRKHQTWYIWIEIIYIWYIVYVH